VVDLALGDLPLEKAAVLSQLVEDGPVLGLREGQALLALGLNGLQVAIDIAVDGCASSVGGVLVRRQLGSPALPALGHAAVKLSSKVLELVQLSARLPVRPSTDAGQRVQDLLVPLGIQLLQAPAAIAGLLEDHGHVLNVPIVDVELLILEGLELGRVTAKAQRLPSEASSQLRSQSLGSCLGLWPR